MTHLSPIENLFAVEVPRDARNFKIYENSLRIEFGWKNVKWIGIDEPGSYEVLFTTKDCSEEQAGSVVEFISPYITVKIYKDYETGYFEFDAATPSLKSLLRANQLHSDSANYLLIKKQ